MRVINANSAHQIYAGKFPKSRPAKSSTYKKRTGTKRHEHRFVAEEKIGRPLRSGEIAHHKNGNKHDNQRENIEVLLSQSEHARVHFKRGRFVSVP